MKENQIQELRQKNSKIHTTIKVVLDIALIIAVFYAGHVYGEAIFEGNCPTYELIGKCYGYNAEVILRGLESNTMSFEDIVINVGGNIKDDTK